MGNSVRLEKSGVQMILIFESAPEKIKRSVLHEGLSRWPLIGDPENVYYKKYDIEHSVVKMLTTYLSIDTYKNLQEARKLDTEKKRDTSTSRTLLPADFFIDENFKIVRAYYGKNIDDHVDLEELKQFAIGKPKQRV
jgi:peroxiredoxin